MQISDNTRDNLVDMVSVLQELYRDACDDAVALDGSPASLIDRTKAWAALDSLQALCNRLGVSYRTTR